MDLQFTSGLDLAIAPTRMQIVGLLAILPMVPV